MESIVQKRTRILYLDLIRSVACILVIAHHSPQEGTSSYIQNIFYYLSSPNVCLFLMVSGALLLPIKEDAFSFYKRRFSKVLLPTLFWSLFYLIILTISSNSPLSQLPKQIISIPFSFQGNNVLWFMYMICGLYLLAPIISPWIRISKQKELLFFLLIWCITLLYPILRYFVFIDDSIKGILYYFSGYIGYFLLGYYLHIYSIKINNKWLSVFILIPIVTAIICKQYDADFCKAQLGIFVAMMTVFWFLFFKNNSNIIISKHNKFSKILVEFSNCSFGIFFIHPFFIWNCLRYYISGGFFQTIIILVLTTILSFGASYIISFLPISKYIIGYSRS